MLKIHKAIIGRRYFNVTYIILPLVFTLLGALFRFVVGSLNPEFFLMVQAIVMLFEISSEYFGYGPIYRKNNLGMEYLKTSVGGMALFKKSILTDLFLRIARTLFYTLLPAILVSKTMGDPLLLFVFALVLADVSVWSVSFTRYVTMYGFLVIVTSPLLVFGVVCDSLCLEFSFLRIPVLVICLILLVAGVIFTNFFAEKKIRASYSDLR